MCEKKVRTGGNKWLRTTCIAAFGIFCFTLGFACSALFRKAQEDVTVHSFGVFSSVTFDGVREAKNIPWNYTAGIFDMEQGQCILLTPNTSVDLEGNGAISSWCFQYRIHPWVAEGSDGAGLLIWILDEDENILYSNELSVKPEDQWQSCYIDMSLYETASKIRIFCNNGAAGNDDCDWIILREQRSEASAFDGNYARSATYFADEWPINFWNCEMDRLEEDLTQIKADGFDSIIIVIPWREFQPDISPVSYNAYAFDKLDELMRTADQVDLKVYARLGYTWDFYKDENDNIIERYFSLLGDSDALAAWDAYIQKMYQSLSAYDCFAEAFLTWEDFWGAMGVCDIEDPDERTAKADYIKFGEWVSANYSLEDYNRNYQTDYTAYGQIPIPHRSEPALWAMYEFYDDFLIDILKRSQQYFPNLSMEVRMDWDLVTDKQGDPVYYQHTKTYDCADSNFSTTMYGIPMGFENSGERVSYDEALAKTKYILEKFKEETGGKAVYIDQFIFADNTPAFSNNAQIKEEELDDYLLNAAEILHSCSDGYGIWTYRNYRANMLYNPQFALEENGWSGKNIVFQETEGSMVCHIMPGGSLSQTIPNIRNHFSADKYYLEFDVVELTRPGTLKIQIGNTVLNTNVTDTGKLQLTFDNPANFDLHISSADTELSIDNLRLYCQIQQGYLYDEDLNELECIDAVRSLNNSLGAQ